MDFLDIGYILLKIFLIVFVFLYPLLLLKTLKDRKKMAGRILLHVGSSKTKKIWACIYGILYASLMLALIISGNNIAIAALFFHVEDYIFKTFSGLYIAENGVFTVANYINRMDVYNYDWEYEGDKLIISYVNGKHSGKVTFKVKPEDKVAVQEVLAPYTALII